mgnify:CR=1 FL=1
MTQPETNARRSRLVLAWVLVLIFDTVAQLVQKMGAVNLDAPAIDAAWFISLAREPMIWATLTCDALAFLAWMHILEGQDVSIAFPASSGCFVSVMALSWLVLGEPLTGSKIVASLLIAMGIGLLGSGATWPSDARSPAHGQ